MKKLVFFLIATIFVMVALVGLYFLGKEFPEYEGYVLITGGLMIATLGIYLAVTIHLPLTVLILTAMILLSVYGVDVTGPIEVVFIVSSVIILAWEFFKSADIRLLMFAIDTIASVIVLCVACFLAGMYWYSYEFQFYHYFGFIILVVDGTISTVNAFRTAVRNFALGGGA